MSPSALKRHSPKPSWRTATSPLPESPISTSYTIAPHRTSLRIPSTENAHTPPTSPRRIAPPCPPIIPTEAAQNKHHRLASPPPTPGPPSCAMCQTYISEVSRSLRGGTARYASPHEENKRDGVLGAFLIPLPFHTSLCSRAPPFHRTCFGCT
jgi:hypothetical protein